MIARRAQTEHQVFAHLVDGQRHQSETVGNALAQLADIRLAQILIQLGLAEQHDLQQLVVFGFQIGQQAHFFQRCQRHALRFFDKNHHALAVGVAFEQVRLYGLHDFEARRLAVEVQMQLEGDGVQNFFRRNARVGEINGFHVFGQALHQHVAQHGLAAADFTAYLDDAFAMRDGVNQCLKDRPAITAAEEKIRVRGNLEGRLIEAEMFVIHCFY